MNAFDMVVTRLGLRFMGRVFPCSIGRAGVTGSKREGDGATPAGSHRIVGLLFRPDRIARGRLPDWAVPIGPFDLWCDDPAHPDYNLMVRSPHPSSTERLRRPDPMYDAVLLTDWNWPSPRPGDGSAIFVHVWRRPGARTAGCVALSRPHLLWIARRLRPQSRLVVRI
ncbi:MAG: L,D-transpeptidase family protein [Rhodobacteraceae bacterium]|nr:L,D-transpeptidase family protein [Paracoccaceae bacterium]